jgi:hypothetical protein
MITGVIFTIAAVLVYAGALWWMLSHRQWNQRAYMQRRLLVEEDEVPVWRTVRARYLVGWPSSKGELSFGMYVSREPKEKPYGDEWAVLKTRRGALVAYRVAERRVDDHKIGVITVCRTWEELERAVPAKVFEEAAIAAGRKKPAAYPKVPLEA